MDTISSGSTISFPFLGNLTLNPPNSITVFGKTIFFYGIIIALAFLICIAYASKNADKVGIKEDDLYDMLIVLIPCSIIGARLYYVLFNLDYYLAHPSEIIAIWEGGLAILGGVLAGTLSVYLVCKRKKVPFAAATDLLLTACLLGQSIGRWGNFMNREAFGRETDIFCKMGLTSADGTVIYVHPTFLYESLWNLCGFLLCNSILQKGRKYDGQCSYFYCAWYGFGRFFIEGLRTDSLYLGNTGIRISQLLSAVLFLFGVTMLVVHYLRPTPESNE